MSQLTPKSSFVPLQTTKATQAGVDSPRVVKLAESDRPQITAFETRSVRRSAEHPAPATPALVAAAAPANRGLPQKDRRFALSAHVQDPAKIEAEARRALDEQVGARLTEELGKTQQGAFDQGFAEGVKQGQAKAHAEATVAAQAELDKLKTLIAAFEGAKAEVYQANERYLLELVFRIGRMLFLKDLSTDKEYLSRLARELVERMGARENIRIRLNPKDAERAAQIKTDLGQSLGELRNLSIEADAGIGGGGLEVQTEWSALDASIDTQLKAIHDAITGSTA